MSTSVRQRASPAAIANAPRVYPVHHDYSYTLTYDVSDTSSISSSQSVSSQEEFDVLDAAAVLSDVTFISDYVDREFLYTKMIMIWSFMTANNLLNTINTN